MGEEGIAFSTSNVVRGTRASPGAGFVHPRVSSVIFLVEVRFGLPPFFEFHFLQFLFWGIYLSFPPAGSRIAKDDVETGCDPVCRSPKEG